MSIKATKVSTNANPSSRASRTLDAVQAAQEAAAASQRAIQAANATRSAMALAAKAAQGARDAQQAVEDARRAERVATDAAKAARSAAAGAARAVRECEDAFFSAAIDRSAHYVVTYNGQLVATFLNEDDALLFEAELADVDQAHGASQAKCEVLVRKSGQRVGGYLLTAGTMMAYVRDEAADRRSVPAGEARS